MKHISENNLSNKSRKEISQFYKVDRFPTTIVHCKDGRSDNLLFVESDNMELFRRQNSADLNKYSIVDLEPDEA